MLASVFNVSLHLYEFFVVLQELRHFLFKVEDGLVLADKLLIDFIHLLFLAFLLEFLFFDQLYHWCENLFQHFVNTRYASKRMLLVVNLVEVIRFHKNLAHLSHLELGVENF